LIAGIAAKSLLPRLDLLEVNLSENLNNLRCGGLKGDSRLLQASGGELFRDVKKN
jgi:hypothetical protein